MQIIDEKDNGLNVESVHARRYNFLSEKVGLTCNTQRYRNEITES
jgi:hypothetical protein